jgi:hypothetical protein
LLKPTKRRFVVGYDEALRVARHSPPRGGVSSIPLKRDGQSRGEL